MYVCGNRKKVCKAKLHKAAYKRFDYKKVEGLAEKDRAQNGIIFRNLKRETFEWDKKEYNDAQDETGISRCSS